MSERCIFCEVAEDAVVYRDHNGVVILDDPIRPGHVLIGARAHGESLHDITAEDAAGVLRLANRVAKAVVSLTGATKVYVAAIGDKDKHFHVHLLPKFDGDANLGPHVFGEHGWAGSLGASASAAEFARVNDALRRALRD
jgi:diadenosine tetraphosphate (Ap4A) HIT family hydrolase